MKILQRITVLFFLVLCAGLVFAGGQGEPQEAQITLWSGYPDLQEFYEEVVADFQAENPGIQVEVQTFALSDLNQKLGVAIPSKTAADIIELISVHSFPYAEKFFVEVPAEVQAEVMKGVNEEYLHDVLYDGKMLGVPFCFYSEVLYYNKDHFAEAGLKAAPDTMEQLVDYAARLTKYDSQGNVTRSGISLRFAGHPAGTSEKFWALGLLPEGGDILTEAGDGKYRNGFNNDAGYKALKLYIDLLYKHKVTDFKIIQDADSFATEKSSMFEREQWVVAYLENNSPDLNYDAAPLPKSKRRATFAITRNMFVPEFSKNQQAGWQFVNFFYQKPVMAKMVEDTGWLSTRKDLDYKNLLKNQAQLLAGVENPPDLEFVWQKRLTVENEIMGKMGEQLANVYRDSSLLDNQAKTRAEIQKIADTVDGILKEAGLYGE
ncbi:MAG: extracellular solute-binding protein [Spirochaetales bacterium]|nr:extracellular solute-binding protein [Spirochaetales bacterium]